MSSFKFQVDLQTLEEIALCIVDCGLSREEACEYVRAMAEEAMVWGEI